MFFVLMLGFTFFNIMENKQEEEKLYSGPVPIGYNLNHFRLTGETVKLENGE